MKYTKTIKDGKLFSVAINGAGIEITETEYNALLQEIQEKAALVDKMYNGEIAIVDVPAEWQEEIERRVNERIAAKAAAEEQDISDAEALDIILGGEV